MLVFRKTFVQRKFLPKAHISSKLFNRVSSPRHFSDTTPDHETVPHQQSDPKAWSWAKYFKKSKSYNFKNSRRLPNKIIATSELLDQQLGPQMYHNGYVERAQYAIILLFLKTVIKEITIADSLKEQEISKSNDLQGPDFSKAFDKVKMNSFDKSKSQLLQIIAIFESNQFSKDNNNLLRDFTNSFQLNDQRLATTLNEKNYNLIQDFRFMVSHPSWKMSTLEKVNLIFQNNNMTNEALQRNGKLFDILKYKTITTLGLIELLQNCNEFLNDKLIFAILKNFNLIDLFQNYSIILHHCLINDKHLTVPEYLFCELAINTIQSKNRSEFIRLASLFINDVSYSKIGTSIKKIDFNSKIWNLIFDKTLNRKNVTTNYVQTFENTYHNDYLTDVCAEEDDANKPVFLKRIQFNNNNLIPPEIMNKSLFKNRLDFTNFLIPNSKNFFYQKLKPNKIRLLKENSFNPVKLFNQDENTIIQNLSFSHGNFHKFNTISIYTALTLLKGCLKFHELEFFDLFMEKIIMDSYFLSFDDNNPRLRIRVSNRVELDKKFLAINNLNFEPLTGNNEKFVNTDIEKIFNLDLLNLYLLRLGLSDRENDESLIARFNWVKNLIETVYIRPITLKYVSEINNLFVSDRKTFSKKYNNIFNKDDIIKLEIFNHLKRNSTTNSQVPNFVDVFQIFGDMKSQREKVMLHGTNEKMHNDFDLYLDRNVQIDLDTMKNFYKTAMHLKQVETIDFFENEFFISWKHIIADKNEDHRGANNYGKLSSSGSLRLNIKKLLLL